VNRELGDEHRAKIDQLASSNEVAREQVAALQSQNDRLTTEKAELEELVANQAEIRSQLEADLDEQTGRANTVESRLAELQEELEQKHEHARELEETFEKLQEQLSVNRELGDEHRAKIDQLASSNEVAREQVAALQSQNDRLTTEKAELEELVANQAEIRSQLEADLDEQTGRANTVESRLAELQEELEQKHEHARELLDRKAAEDDRWKQQTMELEQQLERNRSATRTADLELELELKEAKTKHAELERLREEERARTNEEWRARVESLREEHSKELDYWKAQLDDQIEKMEEKSIQMVAALEEARAQYEALQRSDYEEREREREKTVGSKLSELEEQHSIELGYWKTRVDDQRRELDLNSIRMAAALEEASNRYAALERKHDKEVKEWQMLLDADFARGGGTPGRSRSMDDDDDDVDSAALEEDDNNDDDQNEAGMRMIGAVDSSSRVLLSPIRKAESEHRRENRGGIENANFSEDYDNSSVDHSKSIRSQSISNKIDDLLEEIGEMGMERSMILKEINKGIVDENDDENEKALSETSDQSKDSENAANQSSAVALLANEGSAPITGEPSNRDKTRSEIIVETVESDDEPSRAAESLRQSRDDSERQRLNESDSTTDSEVLDQTLHLLNNLKTMLNSPRGENEHETSVLEHLEVLSGLMDSQEQAAEKMTELMQSQDRSPEAEGTNGSVRPSPSGIVPHHETPDRSETGRQRLVPDGSAEESREENTTANDTSWISAVKSAAAVAADPWPALVAELRSRCEFLERDRDDITRITAQILESERSSHKAELEAAMATAERKANETIHTLHMEKNREMNTFYENICWQCQQQVSSVF